MARVAAAIVITVVCALAFAALFAYSGMYDVAADSAHWPLTQELLAMLRNRSIETASASIEVPKLDDPAMVADGARDYAEMCGGCHLSPASRDSEARQGLNPQPPDLYRYPVAPRRAFWVIKHGVKMSGMPAWGPTHDDATIWSMVAFLRKMPELDAQQYRALVSGPGEDHGHAGHHH